MFFKSKSSIYLGFFSKKSLFHDMSHRIASIKWRVSRCFCQNKLFFSSALFINKVRKSLSNCSIIFTISLSVSSCGTIHLGSLFVLEYFNGITIEF